MVDRIKIGSVLLSLFIFACCSSDRPTYYSYSFEYAGTLADSGTVKMTVDIVQQFSNANCKKITVSKFEIFEK